MPRRRKPSPTLEQAIQKFGWGKLRRDVFAFILVAVGALLVFLDVKNETALSVWNEGLSLGFSFSLYVGVSLIALAIYLLVKNPGELIYEEASDGRVKRLELREPEPEPFDHGYRPASASVFQRHR